MLSIHAVIVTVLYLCDLLLMTPKYTLCKYDHTPRTKKLIWKGSCVGLPLLILIFETLMRHFSKTEEVSVANILLIIGMLLCAVGDIILEIRFVKGGCLFFAGHVTYVAALYTLQEEIAPVSIIFYAMLVGLGTYLTLTKLSKKYRAVLIGYNLAISGSFAMAVPLIITGEPAKVLLGTGACFLVISDWLLARNKSFGSNYTWSLISLLFYFGGQILISAYPLLY